MEFGLFLLGSSPGRNHKREYDEMLEQAEYAEELGFSSVWLAEHHGSDYGSVPSPAILAAAIAQRTSRLRLGVAVAVLPFEHPVRVAEDWAMVDVLSDGRLDFGVGRGYQPPEFDLLGVDQAKSREVFMESLDVILGLWSNRRFTYDGTYYQLDDAEILPRPIQDPVPVFVAALSPPTFAIVAERGLQLMASPVFTPLSGLKVQIVRAARALIEQGRDPADIDFPFLIQTYVGHTRQEALESGRSALAFMWERLGSITPGGGGVAAAATYEAYEESMKDVRDEITDETIDELAANRNILLSDTEGARDFLRELRDELGVKRYLCFFGALDHRTMINAMEFWAAEIMPGFQEPTPVPAAFVAPVTR